MRALLSALLAPALASAGLNYGRTGQCIAVTSSEEHFGGDKRIVSSMGGDCRRGTRWWTGQESSGHFRVDAGCKLTLYRRSTCIFAKGSRVVLDATGSSDSKTFVMTNLKNFGIDNWIRASKCECAGAAMQRLPAGEEEDEGALSLDRAVNRSVLVKESEEEEDEEELDEDEENEDEENEDEEDEEEEVEGAALAQVDGHAEGASSFPTYNQYSYREGDSSRNRRRQFNWAGHPACAWLWFEEPNFNLNHRAFARFAGRNKCINTRTSGRLNVRDGNRVSSGYALSDRRCRVIFYSKKNCRGDVVRFNPKSGDFSGKGSARILGDFDKVDMDNDIESTRCFCKGR